jgi:hypothetical protein
VHVLSRCQVFTTFFLNARQCIWQKLTRQWATKTSTKSGSTRPCRWSRCGPCLPSADIHFLRAATRTELRWTHTGPAALSNLAEGGKRAAGKSLNTHCPFGIEYPSMGHLIRSMGKITRRISDCVSLSRSLHVSGASLASCASPGPPPAATPAALLRVSVFRVAARSRAGQPAACRGAGAGARPPPPPPPHPSSATASRACLSRSLIEVFSSCSPPS